MAVRTTWSVSIEHLSAPTHAPPQSPPWAYGPFGQEPKAVAASARVVRMVRICMIAGGGRAWGLREVVCLVDDIEVCVRACDIIFVVGMMDCFYRRRRVHYVVYAAHIIISLHAARSNETLHGHRGTRKTRQIYYKIYAVHITRSEKFA